MDSTYRVHPLGLMVSTYRVHPLGLMDSTYRVHPLGLMVSTYRVPLLDSKLLRLHYAWYYRTQRILTYIFIRGISVCTEFSTFVYIYIYMYDVVSLNTWQLCVNHTNFKVQLIFLFPCFEKD